jgi:hypothetical protein
MTIHYRANLSSASFPFVSEYQGQTIIVPGPDNTYNRLVSSPEVGDRDAGIPQLFYCHNVLPTSNGFQSVTYVTDLGPDSLATRVVRIFPWYNLAREGLLGVRGTQIVTCIDGSNWRNSGITLLADSRYRLSKGTVNGETYLYVYGIAGTDAGRTDCYTIDLGTAASSFVTLTGLGTDVRGICAASGYLLAYTETELAWSSITDPTDFTPSLITGAGGAQVQEVRGRMVCIQPSGFGAIIYSEVNAVAVTYSGNARYPFSFEEIKGAGGAIDFDQPERYIASDANSTSQFALTTNGLQVLGPKSATRLLPELEDFIVGSYYEDFDEVTDTFTRTQYGATGVSSFAVELTLVAARYICLSYGPPDPVDSVYTYIIVYDLALKRYGKLKIRHVSLFDNLRQALTTDPPFFANIGVAKLDGSIVHPALLTKANIGSNADYGVAILGKYQYVRSRLLDLSQVTVENIHPSNVFTISDLGAVDGKNYTIIPGYPLETAGFQRTFSFTAVGKNHSLLLKGSFNLSTLILEFHPQGRT